MCECKLSMELKLFECVYVCQYEQGGNKRYVVNKANQVVVVFYVYACMQFFMYVYVCTVCMYMYVG